MILNRLQHIAAYIADRQDVKQPASLYLGKAGDVLFQSVFNKIEFKDEVPGFDGEIDKILRHIEEDDSDNFTFCSGMSGSVWLINYLSRKGYLDIDSDFFDDIYPVLGLHASGYLNNHNYDFLHGAGGLIFTMLEDEVKNAAALEYLVRKLLAIRIEYAGHKVWRNYGRTGSLDQLEISLGLSHGLPSMMVLLSKIYAKGILQEECLDAINECYSFMKQYENPNKTEENYGFYPTFVKENQDVGYMSRLGWCYGDLSIGAALFVVGKNIQNKKMIQEAEEIYVYYADYKNSSRSFAVSDSCLCHGTGGLMHMFRRMYKNTGNETLKKTADYWAEMTLKIAYHKDGILGYKYHFGELGWQNDATLLNGLGGVGITMASYYLDENPDWDECFLLS